jgi:outer membrane protein OmpA-like peptidoglycan-associated protein
MREGDNFMTKRSQFVRFGRQFMLWATVALAITGGAMAQSAGTAKPAADDGGYSTWDMTPYFGWQWFQAFQGDNSRNYTDKFQSGWVFGEKFDADFSNHVSIEGSAQLGRNILDLRPYTQNGFATFVTYNAQFALDLQYNFQPRTAKNRVYVLGGFAGTEFIPKNTSGSGVTGNFVQPAFPERRELMPGVNYAIGLKHYINQRWGLRFEVGGRVNKAAHFGLPQNPTGVNTLSIPANGKDSSLEALVGVIIREGYVAPPPPPNPLISQSVRVDIPAGPSGAPTISGAHDVCAGDDLRLSVNASGVPNPTYAWTVNGSPASGASAATFNAPTNAAGARTVTASITGGTTVATSAPFPTSAGHTYHLTADPQGLGNRNASYQWMVNGQPAAGATSSSYDIPDQPGASVTVQVTVQNPPVTSSPATFTIQALTPPNLTFAVNPNTVPYTSGPIQLAAVATPSPCGGAATVRYSGEGVTGTSFTPGSVSGFDMANRLRSQSKTVTITATATDAKNQTVSRQAPVTVTLNPEARRLDDVVFPNMSSRVNNCGKRLLLEELTPMLRNDPGAKVILIGHRDEHEKGGKTALALDETRVLNSAAVLSAGKGICPQLDLSRIMMKAVGTDQSSTPRPALCGASTNVKEKSGQVIKESDKNAEYRRVEVWIVPSGAADPAGVTGLTPVPADRVSKLGCPK